MNNLEMCKLQINRYNFITRPTCQFANESGALRWRKNDTLYIDIAGFKQFSFKTVFKCQKRIS